MKPRFTGKITVKGGEPAKVSARTKARIQAGLDKLEVPRPEIPPFVIVTEYPHCEHFAKRKNSR